LKSEYLVSPPGRVKKKFSNIGACGRPRNGIASSGDGCVPNYVLDKIREVGKSFVSGGEKAPPDVHPEEGKTVL